MGEVEDVEVVEVGKHLTLDKAQLVPRQPVVRHNHTKVQWYCLDILDSIADPLFLNTNYSEPSKLV